MASTTTATTTPAVKVETWRDHWRLFLAVGVMVLSPFQYGVDFGMIGGLQAMKGFLEVCQSLIFHTQILC